MNLLCVQTTPKEAGWNYSSAFWQLATAFVNLAASLCAVTHQPPTLVASEFTSAVVFFSTGQSARPARAGPGESSKAVQCAILVQIAGGLTIPTAIGASETF